MSKTSTEQVALPAVWLPRMWPPFSRHLLYTRTLVLMWFGLAKPQVSTTMRCVWYEGKTKFTSPVGLPWYWAATYRVDKKQA